MRYLLFVIVLMGCANQPDTLFTHLDPDDTGVDFRNQIFESDKVNILELEYVYNGGGVSIADFNNDGLSDLFFTGNMVPNKLYLNKGDLEFEDVSENAGIGGFFKWKSGSAVADINSDGWPDIYVCSTISADSTLRHNSLFINKGLDAKGKLTFRDQAKEYGINYSGFSSNAGFFDADQDGDLDLYILTNSKQPGTPVTWRPKVNDGSSTNTDKLYRNNGDGTFTDVSKESGIICEGYGLGLSFIDVNRDGMTDIYVGNDYITNDLLYVNQGGGKFINQIDSYIRHQSKFSMGNDVADINNDGLPEIITVDMLPETNFRKKTVVSGSGYITYINDAKFGYTHQYIRNMLQLNNGDGSFSEIGQLAGVHQTEWSWSPLMADFDNDGFKDLIVTNGFPRDITDRDFISFREKTHGLASKEALLEQVPSVKIPNNAFRNNGNLTFSEVTKEWGFDIPTFSSGAAFADLDNDGDLDYVVNNINDPVSIFRNNLYREDKLKKSHFIRVKLLGDKGNVEGLGSKVTIFHGGKMQHTDHALYRGYISTVENVVHFGLGKDEVVDSLRIIWPDGSTYVNKNIAADQYLTIDKSKVELKPNFKNAQPSSNRELLSSVDILSSPFVHEESDKIDFNIQRTLPHKFSQSGPGIAVGDLNGDKLEDFVLGGSSMFPTKLFIQSAKGIFSESIIGDEKKPSEDTGILLFDADADNDLDLYCVSGSYEFEPGSKNYQDRLLINNGRGIFSPNEKALPVIRSSGSCVRAADFDADGDLDLFIGGRTPPGRYPYPDTSYILINKKGIFEKAGNELAPGLSSIGIVNDAIWTDFDTDGMIDLMIVGEFMPITIFKNTGRALSKISMPDLDNKVGWFNSISGSDLDRDGDIDYVVGNLGINNFYRVKDDQPLTVCAKDFDGNGSIDAILSCYAKSKTGELLSYPIHFWDELNSQSPKFRQRYNHFREFADITTDKFFTPEELKGALNLSANYLYTSVIINDGNNKFSIKPLPNLAQVAPVNGIFIEDVSSDGIPDIVFVGNDYGNDPTYGQYDAFNGLVLLGDGKGDFSITSSIKSGFKVGGDAKALVKLHRNDENIFIASQNRGQLLAFKKNGTSNRNFEPKPTDAFGTLVWKSGDKQRIEFYYGAGYLSQSSRNIEIPAGIISLEVTAFNGQRRIISLLD